MSLNKNVTLYIQLTSTAENFGLVFFIIPTYQHQKDEPIAKNEVLKISTQKFNKKTISLRP